MTLSYLSFAMSAGDTVSVNILCQHNYINQSIFGCSLEVILDVTDGRVRHVYIRTTGVRLTDFSETVVR